MSTYVLNNSFNSPCGLNSAVYEIEGSNITRLIEDPTVQKDIKFDELSVFYTPPSETGGGGMLVNESISGTSYPMIRINDVVYNGKWIVSVELNSSGILPTATVIIQTFTKDVVKKDMPKDGDIMSIFVRPSTDALNYIRIDFLITSCITSQKKESNNKINIFGKMFIPGIDSDNNTLGYVGTSKHVFKEIAKTFKLGFAFNDPEDTDDLQNWICMSRVTDFMIDVKNHAWKDTVSFFDCWIDFFYNVCFVNVNKFLNQPNDNIDVVFQTNVKNYQGLTKDDSHDIENVSFTVKMFSNYVAFRKSPFYIIKWKIINNSGISIVNGYRQISYAYLHNPYLYALSPDDCFNTLDNYSSYNTNILDTNMVLRGRNTYDSSKTPNDMVMQNYDMQNIYTVSKWTGNQYIMADDDVKQTNNNNKWSGNVNKNYNRAPLHNEMNFTELNKMYLEVECDGLCMQVMRGERVPIIIGYRSGESADSANSSYGFEINKMFSGWYIIDSLTYKYKKNVNNDGYSQFSTIMTLKRKEWPTPEDVKKDSSENETNKNDI